MMTKRDLITRRELLQRLALLTGATLAPWRALGAAEPAPSDKLGPVLPQRTLGKTGLKVTMLTVGGSHIGRPAESVAQAVIEAAIESGIRTFDTAQLYQNGGSEERYGKFLTPKYREHVLIFTKTMAEDAATARSPPRRLVAADEDRLPRPVGVARFAGHRQGGHPRA